MKHRTDLLLVVVNILFCCSIFFISSEVRAQGNNSITGFIQDAERDPIPQATVELSDDFHRMVARTTTDGAGRYAFYRLALGRYSIRVSLLGSNYEEQTADVEIISAARSSSSSETMQQNFRLRQKINDPQASRSVKGVIFAQDIPPEAKKLYEKGLSDLKAKRTDQGIDALEDALRIFPTYYLALEKLGEEYIAQQKFKEAVDIFTTATETNSRGYNSHYGLAYSLFQLQKFVAALAAADKAIEINSSSVNGLFLRGVILKQLSRYEEAVESLNKAKNKSSTPFPDIHWQLSLIYTNNLKKYLAAADELELFLKAKPNYADADKVRDLIKKLRAKG